MIYHLANTNKQLHSVDHEFFCHVYLHLSGLITLCFVSFASKQTPFSPPGQTKWILRRKLFRGLFQFIKDGRERVIWYQVLRSPVTPVIALRRTSTSTRSIAHELFAEVLLKYRFGIIQWKMGVVIRGEVCSKKLKSSPETSMFSILVSLSYHPRPYWISHKMMIPLNRPLAWSRFDYILSSKKL